MLRWRAATMWPSTVARTSTSGLVTQVLGQQYHAGACAEYRKSSGDAFSERLQHVQAVHQLAHRGALASGQDEPVHRSVQVVRLTDFKVLHTEAFQHLSVLEEGPL